MARTVTGMPSHLLLCRECGDPDHPLIMPFATAVERGKWAAEHTQATGHDHWWVYDSPKPAAED